MARGVDQGDLCRHRTTNSDRDVEGQVVRRISGGVHTTLNAKRGEAEKLNLAKEVKHGRRTGNSGLDGLAHVTENDVGARKGADRRNSSTKRADASASKGHRARGVVANNVVSIGGELIHKGLRAGNDIGGLVEHVVVMILTNETSNG